MVLCSHAEGATTITITTTNTTTIAHFNFIVFFNSNKMKNLNKIM